MGARLQHANVQAPVGRPKATVMIITYNHAKYIAEAIESVLAQKTDFPFAIHVIDDCSTDGTRDILARLQASDPRLRVIRFRKNFGQTAAFVAGFDAAVAQAESVSGSPLLGTAASLSGSAVSLAISKTNFLERGDTLDVVFKKPLRFSVAGGDLLPPGMGGDTNPIMKSLRKPFAPGTSESNLGIGYSHRLWGSIDGRFNFSHRMNADNITGATDTGGMINLRARF